MHRAAETKGRLNAKLKAEIAWVAARNDRAWYALNDARRRLHAVGLTDDQVFALDGNPEALAPAERLALAFVRKLTVDPALITDSDIEGLRKHYGDFEVAEIVHQVTEAAFFDRVTEAAGLKVED
jgi:alkylhydroperoxidase family enzyme